MPDQAPCKKCGFGWYEKDPEARFCSRCGSPVAVAKCVLVVDDSPFVRKLVGMIITELGHRAVEAPDGVQGLSLAKAVSPDVIILDVAMPNMGGVQVLQELRADARFKSTPVVMLTAEKGQTTVAAVAAYGVNGYILKDQPKEMKARLQQLLNPQ